MSNQIIDIPPTGQLVFEQPSLSQCKIMKSIFWFIFLILIYAIFISEIIVGINYSEECGTFKLGLTYQNWLIAQGGLNIVLMSVQIMMTCFHVNTGIQQAWHMLDRIVQPCWFAIGTVIYFSTIYSECQNQTVIYLFGMVVFCLDATITLYNLVVSVIKFASKNISSPDGAVPTPQHCPS
jgi:hypothetical protein